MTNSNCKRDTAMDILSNMGVSIASWILSTIIEHLIHISQIHTHLEREVLQMLEGNSSVIHSN